MYKAPRKILLALSYFALSSSIVWADEPNSEPEKSWSLSSSVAFVSDYMYRGTNLYDGVGIQPSSTFSYDTGVGTLSAGIWMHLSAEGDKQDTKFFEVDESLGYSISFDKLELKTGLLWYTYPDSSDRINDTAEFYLGASYDDTEVCPFSLSPTLTFYRDYRDFTFNYYELSFSHKVESDSLGKGFNFTPSLQFGFASSAEGVYEDNGLVQITSGLSFESSLGDLALTPSLYYTFKVDDSTVNEFWVSVAFGYDL